MRLLIISLMGLILSACWTQEEHFKVDDSGNIEWSVVVHPDWDYTNVDEVQAKLSKYMKQMIQADWEVEQTSKVVSKQDVTLTLRGNFKFVSRQTDFYELSGVNRVHAMIKFICPKVDDLKVRRSITIERPESVATLGNEDGQKTKDVDCDDEPVAFRFK